ncbi:hypothetical protein Bbelb_106340 [Branchiostoma belcheri]|nr:hypothetical protein Bbelb_106340 [Branchiostoma belcheri]
MYSTVASRAIIGGPAAGVTTRRHEKLLLFAGSQVVVWAASCMKTHNQGPGPRNKAPYSCENVRSQRSPVLSPKQPMAAENGGHVREMSTQPGKKTSSSGVALVF